MGHAAGCQRGDEGLLLQRMEPEPIPIDRFRPQEGGVQAARAQRLDKAVGIRLPQAEFHIRVAPPVGADGQRHPGIEGRRPREADPERADLAACGTARRFGRALHLGGNGVDAIPEHPAGGGEFRTFRTTMEQRGTDLRLQILDLLTEGRLPDAEPLRGAGEVAFLGNGQEVADVTQLHIISKTYRECLHHVLDR